MVMQVPTLFFAAAAATTCAFGSPAHLVGQRGVPADVHLANFDKRIPPVKPKNKIYDGLSISEQKALRRAIEQSHRNLDEMIKTLRKGLKELNPAPE